MKLEIIDGAAKEVTEEYGCTDTMWGECCSTDKNGWANRKKFVGYCAHFSGSQDW